MKTAICLHGYFGNRSDPTAGSRGYSFIVENIFKKLQNWDVFIHSWDLPNQSTILNLYKPTKSYFEPQKSFEAELQLVDEDYFNEGFNRKGSTFEQCTLFNTFSFLYSRTQSLLLKKAYEQEQNFTYDIVIIVRFDAGNRSGARQGYRSVSDILFDPALDMNYLYTALWSQLNAGLGDQWFYSNSANMDLLGTIYQKSFEYFKKGSAYEKAVTMGWPDSVLMDNGNSDDQRQFTNEVLKPKELRSKELMRYPRYQIINNHLLYKWFIIDVGLHEKTKYI